LSHSFQPFQNSKPNNMQTVNFTNCTLAFLEEAIGLRSIEQEECNTLQEWLAQTAILDAVDAAIVKRFSRQLATNAFHWREYDLSMHFIGPIFSLVNFTEKDRFNLFAQESFEAQVNAEYTLLGRVDEVVASGFRKPKAPLFAFSEYKKETDPDGDPNGQCLGAMLVGQVLNGNDLPMYGCVVIGRVWRFVVLEGNKYAFSRNYDGAVYEDACQIVLVLKQLRLYCLHRTQHLDS
jgi:hypothetical protein